MLTSTRNPRIQQIRKLQSNPRARRMEGLFVAEGVRLIEEAYQAGWIPEILIYTQDIPERGREILTAFGDLKVEAISVANHVMQAASDTQNPQGILALFPIKELPIPERLNFLLILNGVRDPGNLGTILRTAWAADIDAVLLPPETADPFSPKVVRSGMGAHFKLPIQQITWDEVTRLAKSHQLTIYLADSSSGRPHYDTDFEQPLALIIGGEAAGAGKQAIKLATQQVHIPMPGSAESLNAAAAAAVLIFEVVRQRGIGKIV